MNTLILLITVLLNTTGLKHEHVDQSVLTIDMSKYDRVNIYNNVGEIRIKPTSTNKAVFETTRTIRATSSKKLKRATTEIQVDTMVVDGELFVFIDSPYSTLERRGDNYWYQNHSYNNGDSFKSAGIDSEFDFEISLPANTDGLVSTHKGDIDIHGVKGEIKVYNHFGDINLKGVQDVSKVHSHHGSLNVLFDKQPQHDLSLDTHHGDITISFKQTPSARLDLYSYHGSFFTDFEWQPLVTKVKTSGKNGKTKYKIGQNTNVQIGEGEHEIKFKSHHGDMYILKH